MIKAETVEQYYVLQWIEANFATESMDIKLVDRCTVKIRDVDKKVAIVTYAGKDNITLTDDTTY